MKPRQPEYRLHRSIPSNRYTSFPTFFLILALLLACSPSVLPPVTTTALSTTTPSTSHRIANTRCRIQLDVGRIRGTAMPPEWAASGARLVLPGIDLCFGDGVYKYGYSEAEERILNDPKPLKVGVISMPKFVGPNGQRTVPVQKGAYALRSPPPDDDRYPALAFRFFLDFPEGAVRNDVTLPAERVFFTTKCWIDDDDDDDDDGGGGGFRRALERLKETGVAYRKVEEEIQDYEQRAKEEEEEETIGGGGGVFGMFKRASGFRTRVEMSERRTILRGRMEVLERSLPPLLSADGGEEEEDWSDVVVRGANGVVFMREGYMTVKRFGGLVGSREEYHIVGKFLITKILDVS